MSRRLLVVLALPLAMLAACSSDDKPSPSTPDSSTPTAPNGSAGTIPTSETLPDSPSQSITKPTVTLPVSTPTKLTVTDLTPGSGVAAATGSRVILYYVGVRSANGLEFDSNYGGEPFEVTLGTQSVIEGWEQGLIGTKAGMRRQLDIPNELAYGTSDRGSVIKSGDALTFVVDVLAVVPVTTKDDAPDVLIAKAANVGAVTSRDLLQGTGPAWKPGAYGVAQVIAVNAADGQILDSTWTAGGAQTLRLGQLLPGMNDGLAGMKAGGRRQLQIPYAKAFGDAGQAGLGLPAKTDLILVVDLIAVF